MPASIQIKIVNSQGLQLGALKNLCENEVLGKQHSNVDNLEAYKLIIDLLAMLNLHCIKIELSLLVFPDSEFDELKIVSNLKKIDRKKANDELNSLSIREKQITTLMLNGFSSKQIANKMFISINTVKTHRKNIFIKAGINKVTDLNKIFNPMFKYSSKINQQYEI